MKMQRKPEQKAETRLSIGEVAKTVNVKPFVIRFWEKEFNLKSRRSNGGQRSYSKKEVEEIATIKALLHDQGFTIAGAKKHLQELRAQATKKIAITAATRDSTHTTIYAQLALYRTKLVFLKKLLHEQIV